jgi:hypothetical protein
MIATRPIMPIRIPIAAGIAAIFLTSIVSLAAQIPTPDLRNKAMVRRGMMAFNPRYLTLLGPRFVLCAIWSGR